ncbi:MAG TPA: type II toxin-antitoxin system antitoxin SocA domain-containing protein [Kamptonema sp.]|nr:type II toxin-antitoxin system antitoxin SocA domain-containing protein [Kamptonema sp.]
MKSALDVARYFLCRLDREAGDTISPLKLQKLVYYAQAWSLVFRNHPLFDEDIEAWVHGPVVREVWKEYQDYKYSDIPESVDLSDIEFEEDEREVLEEVWSVYGELSAKRLEELTHSENPWIQARKGLEPAEKSTNIISHEQMKNYYASLGVGGG